MTETRTFHDLFGDEEKFLSNPVGDILENHKIKRMPDECKIGNKRLSDVLDDTINNVSISGEELVADAFPEVAVRRAGDRTYLLTASSSDLIFHIPSYSPAELNSRLFASELLEILLEEHPKLMSEDWIQPPTTGTSLILGSLEDPDPLTEALALRGDEFGCQIESDQESNLWKRYGKNAKSDWSQIAGGPHVCKAPPNAEYNWFANRLLGAIALDGQGLDPDFMEEWGEHLNQNADLNWVSSRCTVYGQDTGRCEGEQTMWLNLEAPIKKDREVSIQLQGGWTWVGRFKGQGGWKSLTSDDFHLLDHLYFGNIITSTGFRDGQIFERKSDEFPGESVTIIGGHGIMPSSTVKAISGILEEINFDSSINFIVRADLDDSTVPKKKLKNIREGWGQAPRFIHSRHSPEVHTDQAGELGATFWPNATAGWVGASRGAAEDEQSPLNRIMRHHLTRYEKHPEFHPIFIADMRLQETLQSDCIIDSTDIDQALIWLLSDIHGDGEIGIRMFFMQAVKVGQSWELKRHRVAIHGTTSQILQGQWDPEDADLDSFRQDWPTGLTESPSETPLAVLVCDETDLLSEFTNNDVKGISHDNFLLDSVPKTNLPIFRKGIEELVQALSAKDPDGDTQKLCQILSDNLELMYGTDEEDSGVAEAVMRTDLNEHRPPPLGPAFKIFLPKADLSERVETNLERLGEVLADLKGVREDDVAAEIRDVKPDSQEAWQIYNSRKVILGERYLRRQMGDIAPSRKQWDANMVLLSWEQANGLFPNYRTGDNTGWSPPLGARFCVIPRSHGIDFMLEHKEVPRFHIFDDTILGAEPTVPENDEDRGNQLWSFVQGLISLKNSIERESGEFSLPPLEEREEYDRCNIFSFGSESLLIGQHGWDLRREGGLAVLTDSPYTASIRQKNGARFFLTEILGITRADLGAIRIDRDASDADRESLAPLLGTDPEALGALMDTLHHSTSADFLNPFNDLQSGDWWQRHGTKVAWKPGIGQSLTRKGTKELHKAYQESLLKLLRNPSPADEIQERCAELRIRERYDVDNEFERELYRGIHSMIAEEPRIYVKADGDSPKMHVGRIESDSERQEALGNLDLFPGNVLFLSPYSANRLKMTAQDGGIRVRAGVRFGEVFRDLLKNWDKLDEIITIKDVFEFNDESDDTSMSMKVHKFHLVLIAALDDALSEYTSEMP